MATLAAATLPLLSMTCTAAPAAPEDPMASSDPLSAYEWKKRPLVVVASSEREPRISIMKQRVERRASDFQQRDMVLLIAADGSPASRALRKRLGSASGDFGVYLVGKDGGVKLQRGDVVDLDTVFGLIDTMPMRRDEMRRSRP